MKKFKAILLRYKRLAQQVVTANSNTFRKVNYTPTWTLKHYVE